MSNGVVIAFLDTVPSTVPKVLDIIVQCEGRIFSDPYSDDPVEITQEEFDEWVRDGNMKPLPEPLPWDDQHCFFERPGLPFTYETFEQVDRELLEFVYRRRQEGDEALRSGDREAALEAYDRARRVSNESDDYVRVWYLCGPDERPIWRGWLQHYVPALNPEVRAEELGLTGSEDHAEDPNESDDP